MENLEKEKTPQEWEIGVIEGLAQTDELQLLEMAQDCAVHLAAELVNIKATIFGGGKAPELAVKALRMRMARVAVLMDALQLRYGECAEEELAFLQYIDGCLERE